MSSREQILARLRQNRPQGPALPDIDAVPFITFDDKFDAFRTLVRNLGGDAVQLADGDSVQSVVQQRWPQHGRLVDLTVENHEESASPHAWHDVDVAIVPGELAVAESAAVWVSHADNQWRSIYFLTQKLVLVDIYAEWCAQCKELDHKTWPAPEVEAWIRQNAVAVRIDTDKQRPDLAKKLEVRSYPSVILLDADGKELRRILGFQKPEQMRAWLEGR